MFADKRLGLIGAGNMGQALLRGVLHGGLLDGERVLASARSQARLDALRARLPVETTLDNQRLVGEADLVILAVKPQDMAGLLAPLRGLFRPEQVVISIAAGISTRFLEERIGVDLPVLRAMPNTPAIVGQGASAYCRGRFASAEHALWTQSVLDSVGIAVEVAEEQLDAITALSGTGPAYFYYMMEALVAAGRELGLSTSLAKRLVKQTLLGAARLVMDSGEEPDQLRARVSSKGGTTEAAIANLERDQYSRIVVQAVQAAARRSAELGSARAQEASP